MGGDEYNCLSARRSVRRYGFRVPSGNNPSEFSRILASAFDSQWATAKVVTRLFIIASTSSGAEVPVQGACARSSGRSAPRWAWPSSTAPRHAIMSTCSSRYRRRSRSAISSAGQKDAHPAKSSRSSSTSASAIGATPLGEGTTFIRGYGSHIAAQLRMVGENVGRTCWQQSTKFQEF